MGCFQSTEQQTLEKPVETPVTTSLRSPVAAQPDPVEEKVAQPVVNVPRAKPAASDVDLAKLKMLTMRDKMHAFLTNSDETLKQEALIAIRARKEGNMTTFNVFLKRRAMLKERVNRQETMYAQLSDQIDKLDEAQDNADLIKSIEAGTTAINNVMKDVSVARVEKALADNKEAVAYTEEIEAMLGEEKVGDEFYEGALKELDEFEKEQGDKEEEKEMEVADDGLDAAKNIPDVPTDMPKDPVQEEKTAVDESQEQKVLAAA